MKVCDHDDNEREMSWLVLKIKVEAKFQYLPKNQDHPSRNLNYKV